MNWWRWFWIAWAAVGFIGEMLALIVGSPGATLSQQVWGLRGSGFFSLLIFGLLWATYHFIFENRG